MIAFDAGDHFAELKRLHSQVRRCRKCFLWKTRKKAVPGEGLPDATVMLIGEAPGKKEDAAGRPFVGPSGKFLDQMLEEVGLVRENIFITSTIKCIPVPAGKPKKVSIEACNPYLQGQLKLVNPRIVCLLGEVAARNVLGVDKVADVRGEIIRRSEHIFLVTYHPAAARRFPALHAHMRKDFRLLARRANIRQ
ncbi:uracil-DNA glycosylase [Candidatus Poribacteria bacterium]|nr:uracil-DNA glycosylase [Candidatus Poribacteria bacterium]